MKPHPHAEVLRAIADGVPISEFSVHFYSWGDDEWQPAEGLSSWSFATPEQWQIRRKPQHIVVNGFKVPKPLDMLPKDCLVFTPDIQSYDYFDDDPCDSHWSMCSLERGIAHATKEAAIAHAKAMLGIDPEYFK